LTPLAFIVPGPLDQLTGGYLFDRQIVEGLRATGAEIVLHELPGSFPEPDIEARRAADAVVAGLPAEGVAVIDGLALLAFADCLTPQAVARLRLLGFIHHPLALETGLDDKTREDIAVREARLLSRLRGVLFPSARTAWALDEYGVPPERLAITPPGTRKPAIQPRRNNGADGRPLRLLAVGTVTPRKGHLLLVEALAALADRHWQLLCVGSVTRDPDTVRALQQAIAAHGLGERVTLAGEWPPERLGTAYAEADLFVLPSYHEGYGMAFAEALAWGLPVIGTTAGAIPETVPASAAMLVPPGDGEALLAALRLVLDGRELRLRLAAAAAAAGAALPDWPMAVRSWAAAVERLVA
jgi:glycosyltransferase involved in cell wall biosynthesis